MTNNQKNLLKGYNMLLYFAGSMVMEEPTEECVIDFWTDGTLKKLPVSSGNPRFIKAAGWLRDSCKDKNICKKLLQEDYLRLFAETGSPLAPAYASYYLDKEGCHDIAYDVSKFNESYGWKLKPFVKRTGDHLGTELLFLTSLIDRYLLIDDYPSSREMGNEILSYMDKHILSWIPKWNVQIQEHACTLCYKAISMLIYACIEDLYGIFYNEGKPL